jgi:hypothetical protein
MKMEREQKGVKGLDRARMLQILVVRTTRQMTEHLFQKDQYLQRTYSYF